MLRLVLLLLVSSLCFGCSSSKEKGDEDAGMTDGGPRDPDPVPADTVCREFADQYCRANERCCSRVDEVYPNIGECTRIQRLLCENRAVGFEYPEEVRDERILYNQGRIGSALQRVTLAVNDCTPIDFEDEIFDGITGNTDEGMPCVRVSCREGLACIGGTCVTQPATGASCSTDDDCGALRCRMDSTCQPLGGTGDGCDVDDDCSSRLCASGNCSAVSADTAYCVRQDEERKPFLR